MINLEDKLGEVFKDNEGHKSCAEIIRTHSTNKSDIREVALSSLGFGNTNRIIDLGCGYGFFTKALCNRIMRKIDIFGIDRFEEYRKEYLGLSDLCGFNGRFYNSGYLSLDKFEPDSVDMVLCSFAMYFFPKVLPKVVHVMGNSGTFIVITHTSSHLAEMIKIVIEIYQKEGYNNVTKLPHDDLINNFSELTGEPLLKRYFKTIIKKPYNNKLIFRNSSVKNLLNYIDFKKSFFVPEELLENRDIIDMIKTGLSDYIRMHGEISTTKNDIIFICSDPIK